MQIHDLSNDIGELIYSTHEFKILIESHLTYLRTTNITTTAVDQQKNYKFEGDFYGLLAELNISKEFHYVIMRVNGYESSSDFKGDVEYIVMPDLAEVQMLANILETKK